jgi:hypothetical protein
MKIMQQDELGGSCRKCVHYLRRDGWWCGLVSLVELQSQGYDILEENLPRPEDFVCKDAYEPP